MTMISPVGQLAVLLVRADEQDRASARQIEDEADEAAMNDANDRVTQLLAKADADRNGALVSGLGDIAGGACVVASAFFAPASSSSGSASAGSSTGGHSMDWNAALNGMGKAMPGVGNMFAGQYKGDSDRDDADAARADARAQADVRRYESVQSDEQAASASIQKTEDIVGQMQQAEAATRLAAATFRG